MVFYSRVNGVPIVSEFTSFEKAKPDRINEGFELGVLRVHLLECLSGLIVKPTEKVSPLEVSNEKDGLRE